ncbi:hypothetical protein WAK64_09685 [Bacillus spongiae]|uniref:Tox-SHH domain-containing protein n=1 Tax=Bacillus spongiae TaxID=2683610 RepID=A0ABU8HE66_9BACI
MKNNQITLFSSHHPNQDKWANLNIEGNNTDITHEFNTGYPEMIDTGVNMKDAQKSVRNAYKYFDSLGAFK